MKAWQLILVCGVVAIGFVAGGLAQQPKAQGAVGRYQIVVHPIAAKNTFLLDTMTGDTWRPLVVGNPNGDYVEWEMCHRTGLDPGVYRNLDARSLSQDPAVTTKELNDTIRRMMEKSANKAEGKK